MEKLTLVLVLVVLIGAIAVYLSSLAGRIDRLHHRIETAHAGLDAAKHAGERVRVDVPGDDENPVRICFAGDVLFQGSIGRTDLPGGDHQQLLDSIAAKLLPLPDDTVVLPGHGPQTTIGAERAANPFLAGIGGSGASAPPKGRHGL